MQCSSAVWETILEWYSDYNFGEQTSPYGLYVTHYGRNDYEIRTADQLEYTREDITIADTNDIEKLFDLFEVFDRSSLENYLAKAIPAKLDKEFEQYEQIDIESKKLNFSRTYRDCDLYSALTDVAEEFEWTSFKENFDLPATEESFIEQLSNLFTIIYLL